MMALDKLTEQPRLVYDRQRIERGGGALADYLNDLIHQLEEWNYNLSRYANHFRGWTDAGDFSKMDGGDVYALSIQTAAVADAAITDGAASYTQATTPVVNGWAEHTVPFTCHGGAVMFQYGGTFSWGGDAGQRVGFFLYDGATPLGSTQAVTLLDGVPMYIYPPHVAVPAAGNHTFYLKTFLVGGGTAYLSNSLLYIREFKK